MVGGVEEHWHLTLKRNFLDEMMMILSRLFLTERQLWMSDLAVVFDSWSELSCFFDKKKGDFLVEGTSQTIVTEVVVLVIVWNIAAITCFRRPPSASMLLFQMGGWSID